MMLDRMVLGPMWAVVFSVCLGAAPVRAADPAPLSVDFRHSPPWWQTSISLPDDWQKTLVAKDGSLLYDYPGKHLGFKTRILAELEGSAGKCEWVSQELASPRVPVVRTRKRAGRIEILEEAFAAAPPLPAVDAAAASTGSLAVERIGSQSGLLDWASPGVEHDPAFRSIAVGWNEPVRYRFRAVGQSSYRVFLGLCEGHHREAGRRILDLSVEGEQREGVDLVALKGHNVPAVFPLKAQDLDGDGWIEVSVAAARGSQDSNTILNALWVFRETDDPSAEDVLSGRASARALGHVDCGAEPWTGNPPRNDVLILRLRNGGGREEAVTPAVSVESELPLEAAPEARSVRIGPSTTLVCASSFEAAKEPGRVVLKLSRVTLRPGEEKFMALGVARGANAPAAPRDAAQAEELRARAERFWREAPLPYGRIEVPDPAIQAQLDSAIRNIYQAREIKNGLPAFQVGPTCYRGLWVVDGSFLLEAVTYLGRADEARSGIRYLLGFQREDGAIMLIDGHWKETGIALWAVARHARLTGDRAWLEEVWPKVEKGFAFIGKMREMASAKPGAPNAGLVPEGFSDGGLGGRYPEYTNVYWTLVGMKAAAEAARWLGKDAEAGAWRREYESFEAAFRRAAGRDARTDSRGNRYVPIRMRDDENVAPQKAQWAFLHAVFPGKVFAKDDPLVLGNMAMLEAAEMEDLVFGTGWLSAGIWNYFASFYGHAWLWLGRGEKAARTLYAFANHASPLLAWREEQAPTGKGSEVCGDMPHNWASAEFIRLVRHLLVLERPGEGTGELHLLEGLPREWARPGARTRLKGILTEFGPMSLELRVAEDGSSAHLLLDPPERNKPSRIVLHLDGWSCEKGTVELPVEGTTEREVRLGG